MKKWLFSILLLSSMTFAYANEIPQGLATDHRIKIVNYNADDVVTIIGSHLISTAIYFADDERILHIDAGNDIAWQIAPPSPETPNILFIKPQLPDSDTNMTVITNKHNYQFHLMTHENETPQARNVTYALEFKYPDEEKAELQAQLNTLQQTFLGNVPNDPIQWNYNYSFYGAKQIAPLQAVDNGKFTVFKFPQNATIPAIFAVDSHQNESLVNFKVQGNYVFIQGVKRLYTLRNGDDVVSVYNDSYGAN